MASGFSEVVTDTELHWYAAHVRVNQEKRVATHLEGRGIAHFLPSCESLRQWKDRRKLLDVPLFPGYLFVHIPLQQSLKVLTVPNVVSLVGNRVSPVPISSHEIEALREGLLLKRVTPAIELHVGQRVRIVSGPFQGMEGILASKKNKRVALSIDVIQRCFLVDVTTDEIEPLEPRIYGRVKSDMAINGAHSRPISA